MNPFKRFFDFVGNPSHSRTISILVVLTIALAIPLTVQIAQKQQELRQRAASTCNPIGPFCTDITNPANGITCGPNTGGAGVCQINGETRPAPFFCQQCTNSGTATTPPTPTPTIAPTPTPQTNQVSSNPTCPGAPGSLPTRPGNQLWGGSCNAGDTKYYSDSGSTSGQCYYAACEGLNGQSSPLCWFNSGTTASVPCPTPTAPSTPTCDASKGFVSPCKFGVDTQKNNPTACTRPDGSSGVSIMQCQSNNCWYDSYYDTTPSKVEQGKTNSNWCYPSSASTCSSSNCDANAGNYCSNNQCVAIPNQITCATKPTCPPGYSIYGPFSGNNWACLNGSTNLYDVAPTCSSGATPNPSLATVNLVIGLDGIGTTGSGASNNLASLSNKNPLHRSRNLIIYLTDANGNKKLPSVTTTLDYDSNQTDTNYGKFTGSASFDIPAAGAYSVVVKSDGYLAQAGTFTLTPGATVTLPDTDLLAGDADHDGRITILDYNFFPSCMFKAAVGACASADLDDSGTVDQFDYNLFIREYKYVQDHNL